jgi:S1-C subfamily serine protease
VKVDRAVLQQLSKLQAPNCPPLRTLGDFLDQQGAPEERAAVELHLRTCPSCVHRLIDLQELAFLQRAGEEPSREVVEAVKSFLPPQETQKGQAQPLGDRIAGVFARVQERMAEWFSPRFLGEIAAAVATAAFLVFVGTAFFQPSPPGVSGKEEVITPFAQLGQPEQKILTSLSFVAAGADPWQQRMAALLAAVPAAPVVEKTRGATNVEVYQKAVAGTVLVVTDRSVGSGAVISSKGEVLTNWHVIQGAHRVAVIFKPQEGVEIKKELAFAATPLKTDPVADLALLQIQAPPPEPTVLSLGDLSQVQVGQDVHAIGHPKQQTWTYTAGLVSQIRPQYQWRGAPDDILHQATVIQTQTPINPGNSGGPLLDDHAAIIGINSFRGEGEGLNYAVAVDTIKAFLQKTDSTVTPPLPSEAPSPAPPANGPLTPPAPHPVPGPMPSPVPGPQAPAYRMESYGTNIVGVYVDARVPPPDVWLVYSDGRRQPAYAARGQTNALQINTVVHSADPRWQALVYYFDTNCDGSVDLIGYSTTGDGTIDRYDSPPQGLQIAELAQELVEAFQHGTIPYTQVRICQ